MAHLPKIEFLRVRSFSERLNASFEFIRQNFGPLFRALGAIVGPVVVLSAFGLVVLATSTEDGLAEIGQNPVMLLFSNQTGGEVAVVFFLIYFIASLVVFSYMRLYFNRPGQASFSVEEVFGELRRHLLGGLVSTLAMLAALAVLPLLVVGTYLLTESGGFTFLVGLLCFWPFAYIALPLWNFLLCARVLEKLSFVASIKRAFAVVKDNWWPCLGFSLIASLLQNLIAYTFYLPLLIYYLVVYFTVGDIQAAMENKMMVASLAAIYYVGAAMLQCISLVAIVFQFYQLVEEQQAVGLTARIALIGQPLAQDWDEDF
jgi:hypothetical protein